MLEAPAHYALAVTHPVPDLLEATEFLGRHFDFTVRARGEDWCDLSNGALTLHLVHDEGSPCSSPLALSVLTPDLEGSTRQLQEHPGLIAEEGARRVDDEHLVRRVETPFGLVLHLTQHLSQGERGRFLPFPAALGWDADAEHLVQTVLRFVSLPLRGRALARVAAKAEALAMAKGRVEVHHQDALEALLATTPEFQQERLRAELQLYGLNPAELETAELR